MNRQAKGLDIAQQVKRLFSTIMYARLHYEVWATLRNADQTRFLPIMRPYNNFFSSTIRANRVAMVMALTCVWDDRSDTINIKRVLKLLRSKANNRNKLTELESKAEQISRRMQKIHNYLRSNVYAHMSAHLDIDEAFSKTNTNVPELRDLIDDTEKLLREINEVAGGNSIILSNSAEYQTQLLLEHLEMLWKQLTEQYQLPP